ncbi:MAG: hypothetical protein FJW83_03800 [Actinobacteria bacterium]|nr:hypothetical protein [Actinomycetota bacterium]
MAFDQRTVHADTRRRVIAVGRSLDAAAAALRVPACPEWTVHDVFAHVLGVPTDIMDGRTTDLGSDAWTANQVERFRGRPLDEVLDVWEAIAPRIDAFVDADPIWGLRFNADLVTHEHDLAGALGRPAPRDGAAVEAGLARYLPAFHDRSVAAGLAPVTPTCSPFELLRALTGRRSSGQMRALGWPAGVDPTPYLPLLSNYGVPTEDLVES